MWTFQTDNISAKHKLSLIIAAAIALMLVVPFDLDVRDPSNGLAYHMDPTSGPLATVSVDGRLDGTDRPGTAAWTPLDGRTHGYSGVLGTPIATI